jgi:hypothetical protein
VKWKGDASKYRDDGEEAGKMLLSQVEMVDADSKAGPSCICLCLSIREKEREEV